MLLSLLFDGRFDEYVQAARRDAGLWLFVHVPKTAGSSLSTELASLIPPYHNIHIDHRDRSRPALERFDAAVDAFLAATKDKRFRCASGHIQNRHMEQIHSAVEGVRCVTMLRDPVARLVSDYRYQRSPMHPLSAEVIQRIPNFQAFIELPGQRNRTARHLVPAEFVRQERIEDSIAYIMDRYAFVGLQEMYGLSFRALTALVAEPRNPTEKKRVNEGGEKVDLAPEDLARVAELNRLDLAIYHHFQERLREIESKLAAWVEAQEASLGRRAAASSAPAMAH